MSPTTSEVTFRAPVASDAPALSALIAATGIDIAANEVRLQLAHLFERGDWILVAVTQNQVVGVITVHDTPLLHRNDPVARVTLLAIADPFRGRGIRSSLIELAERSARQRGIRIMEVISNHRYADAHGFYRKHGYAQTSLKFKKQFD